MKRLLFAILIVTSVAPSAFALSSIEPPPNGGSTSNPPALTTPAKEDPKPETGVKTEDPKPLAGAKVEDPKPIVADPAKPKAENPQHVCDSSVRLAILERKWSQADSRAVALANQASRGAADARRKANMIASQILVVRGSVDNEKKAREAEEKVHIAKEKAIQERISREQTNRIAKDKALNGKIDEEADQRYSDDQWLLGRITRLQTMVYIVGGVMLLAAVIALIYVIWKLVVPWFKQRFVFSWSDTEDDEADLPPIPHRDHEEEQ